MAPLQKGNLIAPNCPVGQLGTTFYREKVVFAVEPVIKRGIICCFWVLI